MYRMYSLGLKGEARCCKFIPYGVHTIRSYTYTYLYVNEIH